MEHFHSDIPSCRLSTNPCPVKRRQFRQNAFKTKIDRNAEVQDMWGAIIRSRKWKAAKWDPPTKEI